MKIFLTILVMMLSVNLQAEESCTMESIGLEASSAIPLQLYYTGTCHFRNGDYQEAAEQWMKLAEMKDVPREYAELQTNCANNLGYLLFFGDGVEKDPLKAVSYWTEAAAQGHEEAEYHLCHAYADANASTYDPVKAIPHCDRAAKIYGAIQSRNEDQSIIFDQIQKYRDSLK